MPAKLYFTVGSPPSRSVVYTLKALNLPFELVDMNLLQAEHRSEKYSKMNPQRSVPTFEDDDGFVIWESHAINAYLVNRYGNEKTNKLYPKDPKARAIVDQRMHFDNEILFKAMRNLTIPLFWKKAVAKMTDEYRTPIEDAYGVLEKLLVGRQYVAGDDITIADFSILTNLTNLNILVPVNKDRFPLVVEYMKRGEANIPDFKDFEEKGKHKLRTMLKALNFEY